MPRGPFFIEAINATISHQERFYCIPFYLSVVTDFQLTSEVTDSD